MFNHNKLKNYIFFIKNIQVHILFFTTLHFAMLTTIAVVLTTTATSEYEE